MTRTGALLLLALVWLVPAAATAAEIVLRVGHNGGLDHPYQKGFELFKRIVEEQSAGGMRVIIFPAGQLGPEDKVNNLVRSGLVAAQATSVAGGLAPYVPDIEALDMPFLFRDLDHYYRVVDGPVGRQLAGEIEARLGVLFLGWGFSGVRNVWNAKHPVFRPDDLRRLKLRVISSKIVTQSFLTLGADVTPMAFGEIYNALQQGVIDGAETDVVDLRVERFFEATRYVSLTQHLYLGAGYVFSRRIFDRLPSDYQRIVREAGLAACAEERRAMALASDSAQRFLENKGILFNRVDRGAFIDAARPVYARIGSPSLRDLIQRIETQ